ncbi:MAG: alpha/beta fold hydrolase [Desulfobacteraceae bacterium]
MESLGIVLVHGYTGGLQDMAPLAQRLKRRFGDDAVRCVDLPGHGGSSVPAFDPDGFERAVADACSAFRSRNRRPVLVGHSTGGNLALGSLLRNEGVPHMVVLAATPSMIRGEDLERWERHREGQKTVPLGDVARMVSYINRIGRSRPKFLFPVLILSGSEDRLVPPVQTDDWRSGYFHGPLHSVTLPGAAHDLFSGRAGAAAADCVARALSHLREPRLSDLSKAQMIGEIEPGVWDFIEADPSRVFHLVRSPAALHVSGESFDYPEVMTTDPIQLNIEITSRCNLSCRHCARTRLGRSGMDMDENMFVYLLDLMPYTYKIMLVGLGEPTLHPQVADFVAKASARGHNVGMVTNAMNLDNGMSQELIGAGLRSITFSLDCVDEVLASQVRSGTDVEKIRGNINEFLDLAAGSIPAAVFSAVSADTVEQLPKLAGVVSQLGLKAWMLSDLNFIANQEKSVCNSWRRGYGNSISQALKTAFAHRLPVLSVRGVEVLGMDSRYHDYLLTSPAELARRSVEHHWCLSPWQTLPVDVDGNVTLCDCQPSRVVGNLTRNAVSDIWNGRSMQDHRRRMRSKPPPEACRICPRF